MSKLEKVEVSDYHTSDFLTNNKLIVYYLTDVLKDGDMDEILKAIQDVIKAKGISNIARQTGLSRESLYKSFRSGAKPRFETILKISLPFSTFCNNILLSCTPYSLLI